ncbi:Slc34a2 [Symbiodinium natans]|uniref:Slc34a2 protein n=1 Tax=Symbiodinium natans TaxID=878477 RepID=A0A812KKU5_9DINO|nr:Slc34a2 [Symbiodinium natans]
MAEEKEQSAGMFALMVTLKIVGVLIALYFFLFGLDLMGGSFSALGSKGAGNLFTFSDNPIAGLMVGILATVLVQSSSTSTSIVVGLVGADVLAVRYAIPIIMGANIGTSVTNTIVSMAHAGDRLELERAFSGATVHDMFNMLAVLTLLPVELIIAAISGEGGLLYWISKGLTDAVMGDSENDLTFPSPTKEIVGPFSKLFLNKDKNTIKALSFGAPTAQSCGTGCTKYCVSSDVSKAWQKVAEDAYASTLTACTGAVTCDSGTCYTNAGDFYTNNIETGRTIKGGFLKDVGDVGGGIIGLILSLIVLCAALFCLVKLLHSLVMGQAKKIIMKGTNMNDYLAILVGLAITILVQSSSVTTSALTPLVGIGVLPVHKMLPMTLGANIGTTITSILAGLAVMKKSSIQIAFCHLLFNLVGILIWFPVPIMRRVVVRAACTLGFYASYWRLVPLIYILVMFVAVPGACLLISLLYGSSVAGGVVLTILAVAVVAAFIYWWNFMGGCYKVVSKEERDARQAEIEAEMGDAPKEEPAAEAAV